MGNRWIDRLAVVDVETSGVSFDSSQLLAMAVVPVSKPDEALEIHIRPAQVAWSDSGKRFFEAYRTKWESEAISPHHACCQLRDYAQRVFGGPFGIVAHNLAFDFSFLRMMFHREGFDENLVYSHRGVDTHSLLYSLVSQGRLPEVALSSSGAFRHFGINVPPSNRHTAMGDAVATRLLFLAILRMMEGS